MTRFKIYLLIPILGTIILFLGAGAIAVLTKSDRSVVISLTASALYLIAMIISAVLIRKRLKRDMVKIGVGYSEVQKEMLSIMAVPYAVMDKEANILWTNYEMEDLLENVKHGAKSMTALFPNITKSKLPTIENDVVFHANVGEFSYKVILSAMDSPKFDESLEIINEVEGDKEDRLKED